MDKIVKLYTVELSTGGRVQLVYDDPESTLIDSINEKLSNSGASFRAVCVLRWKDVPMPDELAERLQWNDRMCVKIQEDVERQTATVDSDTEDKTVTYEKLYKMLDAKDVEIQRLRGLVDTWERYAKKVEATLNSVRFVLKGDD